MNVSEDSVSLSAENLLECVKEIFSKGLTLKEVKNISDSEMEALYSHGMAQYNDNEYYEALKVFQFLCLHDYFQKKYFMFMGSCFFKLEKLEDALKAYAYASALDDEDPGPLLNICGCYLKLRQIDKAGSCLESAREKCESNDQYRYLQKELEAMGARFFAAAGAA